MSIRVTVERRVKQGVEGSSLVTVLNNWSRIEHLGVLGKPLPM